MDDVRRRPGETTEEWVVRMTGLVAVHDAEFYASGGRRLVVRHPGADRLPNDLRDVIDTAAHRAGYSGGGTVGTSGRLEERHTRWSWPAGHGCDPATVADAAATAARAHTPAGWTVHTDDDPDT
ncbi:hypothetical protein Ga0074812_14855 [Parafrankia irregularis]|uniref:Uncharacterized protein n=1 Tax=Parafrankia irregularis TaxID=795642 RepID=A0A0S4QZ86_9ACTN|nr:MULTISPECIES: hypothetical protein [Parafrankia]MBE3206779.1 hypothetical protein [Parafrankia sp. CH37]CUU60855.1 hypothetical protein Ga0074812_14855 [Parafrankia irregularis]